MGYAIWLMPKDDNPFTKTTRELIDDTVPRQFVSESETQSFPPHVTVAPDFDPSVTNGDAQKWLDGLTLPDYAPEKNEVIIELDSVEAEDAYFRKMNLAVKDNANLNQLAAELRKATGHTDDDGKFEFRPHMSLFYGDTATKDVKNKIALIEMKIGFAYGDLFACCGGLLAFGSWIAVVDTSGPVKEWEKNVVAKRWAPWAMWRASRGLL